MKISRWFQGMLVYGVVIALLGCAVPPSPTQQVVATQKGAEMDSQPSSVKSAKARIVQPQVPEEDATELAGGNTAFALDLYRQLSVQEGNLFFSPYSISLALAMTEAGARGDTLAQMDKVLHFTLPQDRLHPAFNALDQTLARRAEETVDPEAKGFKLNIANALWGEKGYAFRPEYLDLLAQNYGAGMQLVDFSKDPEAARQAVNDWVAKATEDKIKDIVPQGAINELTRLVLANAIYFNASWLNPFNTEYTEDEPFHTLDGKEITVPMMYQDDHFGYAKGGGYQMIELPYVSNSLVMTILLPDEGNFQAFEQSLDADRLTEILNSIQYQEVELRMPKFKYESSFDLSKTLKEMGMDLAFDPNQADFTGMADTNELYLQSVVHKAYVSVDEAGTEAAAATVVMAGATAAQLEPVKMTVDRPFLFLIRDTGTGTVLFIGRVTNP